MKRLQNCWALTVKNEHSVVLVGVCEAVQSLALKMLQLFTGKPKYLDKIQKEIKINSYIFVSLMQIKQIVKLKLQIYTETSKVFQIFAQCVSVCGGVGGASFNKQKRVDNLPPTYQCDSHFLRLYIQTVRENRETDLDHEQNQLHYLFILHVTS